MARLGPVLMRALKHSHAMPRDSFSSCLKDRTSERRLTALEMGKKCKPKLEHKAFQSPCLLSMVSLHQRLAFPIKEKEKAYIIRFCLICPLCVGMHRFAQTHLGGNRGFHHLYPKKVDLEPC